MKSRFSSAVSAGHNQCCQPNVANFASDRLLNAERGLAANRLTKTAVKSRGDAETLDIRIAPMARVLAYDARCYRGNIETAPSSRGPGRSGAGFESNWLNFGKRPPAVTRDGLMRRSVYLLAVWCL
jgi:hypothetical protein